MTHLDSALLVFVVDGRRSADAAFEAAVLGRSVRVVLVHNAGLSTVRS